MELIKLSRLLLAARGFESGPHLTLQCSTNVLKCSNNSPWSRGNLLQFLLFYFFQFYKWLEEYWIMCLKNFLKDMQVILFCYSIMYGRGVCLLLILCFAKHTSPVHQCSYHATSMFHILTLYTCLSLETVWSPFLDASTSVLIVRQSMPVVNWVVTPLKK